MNSINIPASIILPPHYHGEDLLSATNYAWLGSTMGHELGHAFDMNNRGWRKAYQYAPLRMPSVNSSFHSTHDCLVEQYSDFCPLKESNFSVQCVDGERTYSENWADALGIRLAYNAYKQSLSEAGKSIDDVTSPGDLTYEQQFFTELTKGYCRVYTNESMHQQLISDVHSPGKYRVLGMLQNFPEFASAFGCLDEKTGLPPKNRCQLWE